MKYFTFFFLTIISAHIGSIRGLFRSVLDRIRPIWGCFSPFQTELDRIGPNWTVLENQKKKKVWPQMRMQPCPRPHGASLHIWLGCASPIGATVLLRWTLILGFCLNLRLPKRVLLLQSLWLLHQSKSGVYSMSIFGLYKLVFHQK